MEQITIGITDVILNDYGNGKGKIIISDTGWDYNFSYYWGAMGCSLREFLLTINSDYFVGKLSPRTRGDFDAKKTFRNIRKYIRDEMSYELPWYQHTEFQKDMREELNNFQNTCNDERQFVDDWNSFVGYTLNYYLIDDDYERKEIESQFNGICEHWNFIETKEPKETIWLKGLHKKLKKILSKEIK